jgi:hypothetical protein
MPHGACLLAELKVRGSNPHTNKKIWRKDYLGQGKQIYLF